jgi:hypothetical protein
MNETIRENCKKYDGRYGCLDDPNRWCMPWGRCLLFEYKIEKKENEGKK